MHRAIPLPVMSILSTALANPTVLLFQTTARMWNLMKGDHPVVITRADGNIKRRELAEHHALIHTPPHFFAKLGQPEPTHWKYVHKNNLAFHDVRADGIRKSMHASPSSRAKNRPRGGAAAFAELHARSAFSFLRAACHPERMAEKAAELGLRAIALCDRDGLYGAPRLFAKCRGLGLRAIVGAELTMEDGSVLPLLAADRAGYRNLSRLITRARMRGSKTHAPARYADLPEFAAGLYALTGDEEGALRKAVARRDRDTALAELDRLTAIFGKTRVLVELQSQGQRGDAQRNGLLADLAASRGLRAVASSGALYAEPSDRPALDVLTCARLRLTLDEAGRKLAAHSSRHLREGAAMRALFRGLERAADEAAAVADEIAFSLDNLGYEFPRYPVPEGETMDSFLRKVTMAGARARYGHPGKKVLAQLERELGLIAKLGFSGYFLIVWDIANFCSEQNILMQGRGSAANSAVCFSLGITACDPIANGLLFERFLTESRKGWPDIDLDLPSGARREAVIQEIYRRYGRSGAAMTANVITFRGRGAAREIGTALGFAPDVLDRFSGLFASGDYPHTLAIEEHMQKAGLPLSHPRAKPFLELYAKLYGLPRHLGQHSGGMVICQGQLDGIVPLEPASMPGRSVCQWDKDDCDDLGIIKVDLLGLGMMAVLQDSIEMCAARGHPVDLAAIPKDDPATYDLLCAAETVGVFQVESRAQMATLPRIQPRRFYDVVVEVAIIRPGPIQGDMVHPYLARRSGKEPVDYPDERLRPVLERTLGIPLFQEQLLRIAMVMAGFDGNEAEELRRALSFHRSPERMEKVCTKLRTKMAERGVAPEAVDRIVKSVTSFALYGFPESHAISFATLAYASAWLKVHRPAEFYCGLFNNQPMGFYSPATLAQDARRRDLRILPVCVVQSGLKCTVEDDRTLRLGFASVRGLSAAAIARLLAEREKRAFASVEDFAARSGLDRDELRALASIGALNALAAHRRDALWRVEAAPRTHDLFSGRDAAEPSPLAPMLPLERVAADFRGTGLTVGRHPMAHLRAALPSRYTKAADLPRYRQNQPATVAGMVICRQRPGTAKGVLFLSLEDETGVANAIVSPELFERERLRIVEEAYLVVEGTVQHHEGVIHIRARRILPLDTAAPEAPPSHDFR